MLLGLKIKSILKNIKELAYKTYVRPTTEYCCAVWDPHNLKESHKLEKVQRRSARWVLRRHRQTSSVDSMLQTLNWTRLSDRRKSTRLQLFYKHHHNHIHIRSKCKPSLQPKSKHTRKSHPATYQIPSCRTNYRKYSYFPRTGTEWNALSADAVMAKSVEAFKALI